MAGAGVASQRARFSPGLRPDVLLECYGPSAQPGLRKLQLDSARAGSIPMQVWLGRQWLAQREEPLPEGGKDVLAELLAEFRAQRKAIDKA